MRQLALTVLALVLAACATAPSAHAPAPSVPQTQEPSRAAQLLASAGGAGAASRTDIERALGAPDIERRDGAGLALTYRLESCALLLLFAADGRNEMRLAEAHPSARRAGETTPSLDQCATEAAQRRG